VGQLQGLQATTPSLPEREYLQCDWQRATELFQALRAQVESYDYVPPETVLEFKACIRCQPLRTQLDMAGETPSQYRLRQGQIRPGGALLRRGAHLQRRRHK